MHTLKKSIFRGRKMRDLFPEPDDLEMVYIDEVIRNG
jgi:hypothetical protein